MNFFLVGVVFKRRSSRPAERVRKLIDQLCLTLPALEGRIASVPFFTPPVEGLLISACKEPKISHADVQKALAELGYESTVHHLSSQSEQERPEWWIDPEAQRLLESGKSFCRLGLLEEARIQLMGAIQRDARCLEAYHYLTALLRRQGRGKEALDWLRQGLAALPEEATMHFLTADLSSDLGRSQEAVDHLKEAIRLKPEAASPYVKLGEVFQKLGQPEQARLAFEEGLARNPNSADAAAGIGSLLVGEGRLNAALDYLQKALAEDDSLHESRLQLGWCLFHAGRPHQAQVEFLRVAREADPTYLAAARFSLGRLYSSLGEHSLACDMLTQVLAEQPDLAEAHHVLARSLDGMGDHANALLHWHRTIELQPQRESELRPAMALTLSRLGEHELAEHMLLQALEESGPQAGLYELLATVYMAHDEWEQALVALRKGETLEPDSANLAFQLGWCLENLDRSEQAELLYSKALRLDPGMIEAYSGLGWLFYNREQYDVALVLFEKALELDPENPEFADHVGWAHLLLKQPGQALGYFRQALGQEPASTFYRTHLAAALFHLERWEDCSMTLDALLTEELDDFLRAFNEYLRDQVKRQLGQPSRAISARRLKLLPPEFVAITSTGRNLSRARKWTEFRSNKETGERSAKRSSR